MPRGISAVVFIISLVFSMTILGGLGFYSMLGADVDVEGQNDDVQAAADQLDGVEFGEGRSSAILQGPLAAVTPVVQMLQVLGAIITNTSGVVQLLYGVPPVVGDMVQLMFRIAMLVTVAYVVRSGTPV